MLCNKICNKKRKRCEDNYNKSNLYIDGEHENQRGNNRNNTGENKLFNISNHTAYNFTVGMRIYI